MKKALWGAGSIGGGGGRVREGGKRTTDEDVSTRGPGDREGDSFERN